MSAPSTVLQALLAALNQAKQGTVLVLDAQSLGGTSAAALLVLFQNELQISQFTLDNVQLPTTVTDNTLVVSGGNPDVTLTLTFQDVLGEVAIQALFQAAQISKLQAQFPALAADYFQGIQTSGSTASVSVPGLSVSLTFTSPVFGVVGLVMPGNGLNTTSSAPRVDGQVNPPSGAKGLFVELATPTSGYRIAPLTGAWAFTDFGWLITGFDVLSVFPAIIPTQGIGLGDFDLNLYPQSTSLSSLSLDIAAIQNPDTPLWSALDGKIQLTDVIVLLNLTYSAQQVLSLSGTGSVQGNFKLGSMALEAQIPFPLAGVWSLTAHPNLSLTVLDDVATLLAGGSQQMNGLLPSAMSALGNFALTYLRIAVDAQTFSLVEFTFAFGSTATWKLIPGVVALDALQARFTIDGTPAIFGAVVGKIGLPHGAEILVTFGRNQPGMPWRLDAISPAIALPSLGDLATLAQGENLGALVQAGGLDQLHFVMSRVNFGITISPTALTNLGLTLHLANAADPLSPDLDWELIPNVLTLTQFSFGFQCNWSNDNSDTQAFGTFVLNGLEFDIRFARQSQQQQNADALIAEYSAQGAAGTVNIKDLVQTISPSVAQNLPDGLVIDVADALLAYFNSNGTKKYLFAMDIAVELPLSDLPLIGKALPSEAKAGLKNLKVIVTSAALSPQDVTFINGLSPVPVLPAPQANAQGDAIPAGFSMLAEVELGELSILVTSPPPQTQGPATRAVAFTGTPSQDPVTWLDVQKTFGPVGIQKIGFSYHDGKLFVVANISLNSGALEIDLLGIGIGSPIAHPEPAFTIQGLAVSFKAGPVSVMGGMIGTLQPLDFVGALSVTAPELALSAFAGYAEYQDHPSFFLYAALDVPLGGPPPFFVTGLAAGLGFNRKLIIPDVSGVETFPLVAWAMGNGTPSMNPSQPIGDQVAKVLAQLAQSGIVAPSVGDYWFAVGIHFTSFEIVESFALLTITVGTDVEIALLGLSTLLLPPDDPEPVAEIQIAIAISFSYNAGLLAIAGQLTKNSYVFARECRLTGGFAFYLWFKGDHAGETILTLGGYNPSFNVPSYYPAVPRLGLNWQVLPELSITGGLYFALTTNVVMAGGKLSAVWKSGSIRAWFTYWADFLMIFKPFHYYIDGGIDLGASFTINLLFCSVTITIHIGVGIALWGPSFAGRATVDLSIISFTITFGDQTRQTDTAIKWDQFVTQLLPPAPASQSKTLRRGRPIPVADPPPDTQAAVVQINVTSGLIRTLEPTADGPCYLVNPETFQCAVLTVIPNKSVTFDNDPSIKTFANIAWAPDSQQPQNPDGTPISVNTNFGVGPANLSPQDFQPALTLSIAAQETSIFHAVRRLLKSPKALWEQKQFDSHGVPQVDPATGLTQSTVDDTLVGLTLIPYLDRPDRLLPIPLDSLLFSLDDNIQPFAWSPATPPTTDSFTDQTVAGTIATSLVTATRNALLGALAAQGVAVDTQINISRLADPANEDLQAAPRLRLLGEQKAA